MSEALVNRVKRLLNAEHCYMNHDWLQECVNYNMSVNPDTQDLKGVLDFVRTQWLLSDLQEINTTNPALPGNLDGKKLVVLPGSYMLQVNEMYDISQSKYKQLQTIRKENTSNVDITEDENIKENGRDARTATKRMIYLKMTDGVQDVVGMEYSPILLFNETLLPGYKVLIKGPVKCRNGVLMLKEGNIEGKGGELARLLIPNSQENILARALGKPENEDPYRDTEEPKNTEEPISQTDYDDLQELLDEDFDLNIDELCSIEETYMRSAQDTARNSTTNNTNSRSTATKKQDQSQKAKLDVLQREQVQCERPYITEPGANDDDMFAECDDIEFLDIPNNQETPTNTQNITTNNKNQVPAQSSKQNPNSASPAVSRSKPITNKSTPLCDILSANLTGTKTIAVKARIKELEKLTRSNGMWGLNCTISDATASMDVSVTNEMLEQVIGLSAEEFSQRKKRKKDPHVFQELHTLLKVAEYSLRVIDVTELEVTQGKKPVVTRVLELTDAQKQELKNRL